MLRTSIILFFLFVKIQIAPGQLYFNFLDYPSPIIFDDLADFTNGVETTMAFEIGSDRTTSSNVWDVMLHATEDLRFGNQTIPVDNIHLTVLNRTPGQTNPFYLALSDRFLIKQGIIQQFRKPLPVLVRLKAIGGVDFMKPAGAYTTTLIFTLVED